MVQILPGKKLGGAEALLSGAIGAAPEALAALTSQMEKDSLTKNRTNFYKDRLGMSEEEAKGLSSMPENVQTSYINKKLLSENEPFAKKIDRLSSPGDQSDEFEDRKNAQERDLLDKWENLNTEEKVNLEKTHPKEVKSLKDMMKQREKEQKEKEKVAPEELERRKIRVREEEKQRVEAKKKIPLLKDQIENLDYLKQFADKTGPFKGRLPTKAAAEFESLGFTAIEPILKIFNPVGPIPVQKVKIIADRFAPRATDMPGTTKGKIAALERIFKQQLENHQNYIDLLESGIDLPEKEKQELSRQLESQLDQIVNEEAEKLGISLKGYEKQEEKQRAGVSYGGPNPSDFKGETIEVKGKLYKSDGEKWLPQ